jgi:serine-type D-Ala-D-Ala carboxypeptidase/endopeptidase (penicillin-binding protein 4)
MRFFNCRWAISAILLLGLCLSGLAQSWREELTTLLSNSLPNAQTGIMVRDAKSDAILFQWHAYQSFTPGSNQKLLSTASILLKLGPKYRYQTTLALNPKHLKKGIFHGNVYIKFTGDPSLGNKAIKTIVKHLAAFGVRTIDGNIWLDNTRFEAPNYAPGWTYDTLHWAYSAPSSAIIVNENKVSVKFEPSNTIGQAVKILPGYNSQFIGLQHRISTVTYQNAMHHCSLLLNINESNRLQLGGCWPSGSRGWQTFAIYNPGLYAGRIIRHYLDDAGITLRGHVQIGAMPAKAQEIYIYRSKPLKVLLAHALKESDNVYAESFTKTLGFATSGHGSFVEGVNAIKSILGDTTDIDFKDTALFDGSGQSRYDLISPNQLSRLLYAMFHQRKLYKTFKKSLPISGTDGTLKYRLGNDALRGKIFAKTGTMRGVSTLSGYMTTSSKRTIVFSIMTNHVIGKLRKAKSLENQLCQTLYQI